MTRSERLRLEGKSDTMYYGTLPIVTMDYICGNEDSHYEETDDVYGIDIYYTPKGFVCVIS